uniref:Uncharacterized protein n=1 Tax=Wuchereria bancrofti TaxID=6293 RepID=A0AAF5PR78_WUCBA
MRQGGIEPPSIAWKATMLTITPLTLTPLPYFYNMDIAHSVIYLFFLAYKELSKKERKKRNYSIMSK